MAAPASYANLALIEPLLRKIRTASQLRLEGSATREAENLVKAKVEQSHRVLLKLEARQAAIGALIKSLQKRKNAACERACSIEDRILDEMRAAGLDRVAGIRCTFSARPAPAALEVVDESLVPAEFLREKTSYTVDKIAAKAALCRGEDVAGVKLTQKMSLVRK